MVKPVMIGELGEVSRGLLMGLEELEIEEYAEIIQTTALLRSARILRRVLEAYCHSDSSEKLTNSNNKNNDNSKREKVLF